MFRDLFAKIQLLNHSAVFYTIKYPLVFLYFSAVLGIELYSFVKDNLFLAFTLIVPFFAFCFVVSERFILFPLVSCLFYFYSLFLDNPGRIFLGDVIDASPSSYLIAASFSKRDLEGEWKRTGVYVRVFGAEKKLDIFDKVLLICRRTSCVKTGLYICDTLYIKKLPPRGVFKLFRSLRERGITVVRSAEESDFLEVLIFAGRSNVDGEIFFEFSKLGIAHMIAISGAHFASIAIAGYFVGYVVSLFIFRQWHMGRIQPFMIKIFFSVLFQLLFLAMCGFVKPAQRAFVMTLVFSLSILSGRPYNSLNTLHLASFIILLVNPYDLWNLSFILSYSGVLFLILFASYSGNRIIMVFTGSIFSSFGVFPSLLQSGIPISYISPFANIVFAPLFSGLISLAAFGVFLGFIFKPLAILFLMIADIFVNIIVNLAEVLSPLADLLAVRARYNISPEIFAPVLAVPFLIAKRILSGRKFIVLSSVLYFLSIFAISFFEKEKIYFLSPFFFVREASDIAGKKFYVLPLRENVSENAASHLEDFVKRNNGICVYICGSASIASAQRKTEFIFGGKKIVLEVPACEDFDLCEFGILR